MVNYMSSKAKQIAVDWVEENEKLITDVHDKTWDWAEVGLQEFKTGKLLADILEKNGFKQEGLLRQRVRKWGQFEDVSLWAILRQEWQDALDK